MSKKHEIIATIFDKRGRAISKATNSYIKTHPFQCRLAKKAGRPEAIYMHAEIAALVKLKDWSKAHSIKIERYNSEGNPAPAKPCPICQQALDLAEINKIDYT
jgi:tRNA(Arg) A34 adenosine deaminase TadA